MVPGAEIQSLLSRYDTAIAELESDSISRIHTVFDSAFRRLERQLRAEYGALQSIGGLIVAQRKLLVLDKLGSTLELLNPSQAQDYQRLMTELLTLSNATGGDLAGQLIQAYGDTNLQPFTGIPIEAVANQASEGVKRLYRYSEDFRDKANLIVGQGLIQGWGAAKVATALRSELGVAKGKAETLARTEVMSALNQSAIARYQQNGIEHFQWWISPSEGLCQFCASRNGKVYKVEDATIPAHPRCRCLAAPFRRLEWQQKGLTDDAFAAEYRQEGLEQLEKNGLKPNNGLTPFEKAAKRDKPPQPVWTPGDPVVRSQPVATPAPQAESEPTPQNQQSRSQGSTAAQFVKHEELGALRSRLADAFGPELVDRAEANLQRLVNENTVGVRVKPETVDLILEAGRFKTKYDLEAELREVQRNAPASDPDDIFGDLESEEDDYLEALADYNQKRRGIESLIMAGMDDIAVEQRPVYGYVQDGSSDYDGPAPYGSVIFEIKPEVKERSTLLGNDSWYGGLVSEATAPNIASLIGSSDALLLDEDSARDRIRQQLEAAATAENLKDLLGDRSGYLEVQMHQQLKVSDVSRIIFTDGEPSPETRRLAEENGIEIIPSPEPAPPPKPEYKPFMSRDEADRYAADSVYDEPLYHGTSQAGANSIMNDGVDIDRNTMAVYGKGFYLARDYGASSEYAGYGGKVLSVRVDIRNPRIFRTIDDATNFKRENGISPWASTSDETVKITELLMQQGYDGVEIEEMGYIVAFNAEQVAVFDEGEPTGLLEL